MNEDQWDQAASEFRCVLFDRTDPTKNAQRFYLGGLAADSAR